MLLKYQNTQIHVSNLTWPSFLLINIRTRKRTHFLKIKRNALFGPRNTKHASADLYEITVHTKWRKRHLTLEHVKKRPASSNLHATLNL